MTRGRRTKQKRARTRMTVREDERLRVYRFRMTRGRRTKQKRARTRMTVRDEERLPVEGPEDEAEEGKDEDDCEGG